MATGKAKSGGYYAWTDIVKAGSEEGSREVIKAGESVSESDFSEDDWAQLVEARSVRTQNYPNMPADFGGSPREFIVKQVTEQLEAAEDMLSDDVIENQAADTGMTGSPSEDE